MASTYHLQDAKEHVVKIVPIPEAAALFQIHLDTLTEICHRLSEDTDQLCLPYQIETSAEMVILRRPYKKYTLSSLAYDVGPIPEGKKRFAKDGHLLNCHELRWLSHQLVLAVQRLHIIGLYHGSLCPENVLIDERLNVYLSDPAPFKPYYLGKEDSSQKLLFYSFSSLYLVPERFKEDFDEMEKHSDLLSKQQDSDVWALAQILRNLMGDLPQIMTLLETRDLKEFPRIFQNSAVDSVVLPLLREVESLQDLSIFKDELAVFDDDDINTIMTIYTLNSLDSLETMEDVAKAYDLLLSFGDTEGMEKLFEMKWPRRHILENPINSPNSSIVLRAIRKHQENIPDLIDYFPALLLHPDIEVRTESLSIFKNHSNFEVKNQIQAKIQYLLNDSLELSEPPISQDLFDLLHRAPDQLTHLIGDQPSLEYLRPLLEGPKVKTASMYRTRSDLKIAPITVSTREDSLSSLESFECDIEEVNYLNPLNYRRAALRRLPFQFDSFKSSSVSPDGEWIVLLSQSNNLSIWNSKDFQQISVPEPRWTATLELEPKGVCLTVGKLWIFYEKSLRSINVKTLQEDRVIELEEDSLILDLKEADGAFIALFETFLIFIEDSTVIKSLAIPEYQGKMVNLIVDDLGIFAVSCTTEGFLNLWDLRFRLKIRSWKLPLGIPAPNQIEWFSVGPALEPPKIWVNCGIDMFIVDLSSAKITQASNPNYLDCELLMDSHYDSMPEIADDEERCCFASIRGEHWAIISNNAGHIFVTSCPELKKSPVKLPSNRPIKLISQTKPTAMNSKASLCFLIYFKDGCCGLLEFLT